MDLTAPRFPGWTPAGEYLVDFPESIHDPPPTSTRAFARIMGKKNKKQKTGQVQHSGSNKKNMYYANRADIGPTFSSPPEAFPGGGTQRPIHHALHDLVTGLGDLRRTKNAPFQGNRMWLFLIPLLLREGLGEGRQRGIKGVILYRETMTNAPFSAPPSKPTATTPLATRAIRAAAVPPY